MKFYNYFNFDSVPPSYDGNGDLRMSGATDSNEADITPGSNYMALVPKGQDPSPEECVQLVRTQADSEAMVAVGRKICFVTDEGRPGLATVVAMSKEQGTVSCDVTVWEKPE
ncbi:hypothetical protein [Streptomyces sp. NPDC001530]|uniref:hypothetical protein n=1 Tax=Streptomyces sp. NPDC001530 TaxID=3364582 RepID=UPI00367482F5